MQRTADGRVTTKSLLAKLESQGFRCTLTGWDLKPETAGVDHTIPISQGGKHELSNIAIVDQKVNRAKNTMSLTEFVEMCTAVADWNRKKLEASSEPDDSTPQD